MAPFMQCFIHLHADAVVGGCVVLGQWRTLRRHCLILRLEVSFKSPGKRIGWNLRQYRGFQVWMAQGWISVLRLVTTGRGKGIY